jgi:hypothetical protein
MGALTLASAAGILCVPSARAGLRGVVEQHGAFRPGATPQPVGFEHADLLDEAPGQRSGRRRVFQVKDGCLPFLCGGDGGNGREEILPGTADIFLSKTSGPAGTVVNVSGEDFAPGEQVVIGFHTGEIGRTNADGSGQFKNVAVTIPDSFSVFAPQKFDIVARGRSSIKSAHAPFTLSG